MSTENNTQAAEEVKPKTEEPVKTDEVVTDPPDDGDTDTGKDETDSTDGSADTDGEKSEGDEGGRRPKNRVQKRIDDLTSKRRAAETEALESRQLVAELMGKEPPKRADFPSDADFAEAKEEFQAEVAGAKLQMRRSEKAIESTDKDLSSALVDGWNQKRAEAAAADPEWEKVVSACDVPMSGSLVHLVMKAPNGPDIAKHLALNEDEIDRLNSLSTQDQAYEFGLIAAKVKGGRRVVPQQKKAPHPPVEPVTKGKDAPSKKKPEEMTAAEFRAWREASKNKK